MKSELTENPALSYLVKHADTWLQNKGEPSFYVYVRDPLKDDFEYTISFDEIAAEDSRILEVLKYLCSPENPAKFHNSDEVWGDDLRSCLDHWYNPGTSCEYDGSLLYIRNITSVAEDEDSLIRLVVMHYAVKNITPELEISCNYGAYILYVTSDWLDKHFQDSVKRLRLAQSLSLSPEETADYIQSEKTVLHMNDLPRDIL